MQNNETLNYLFAILAVFATFVSPIIAVQIQKHLDNQNAKRDRKIKIFKTLMVTRASILDYQHVQAINEIPIEFDKKNKKEEGIIDNWKAYLDHLNSYAQETNWSMKQRDLLIELLFVMGTHLGYPINKTELKNEIYLPMGHVDVVGENIEIRKLISALLKGQITLKVDINSLLIDKETQERQELFQEKWLEFFEKQTQKN